ncbi:MAG: hypothetical protein ACKOYG_06730 [Ilumatobacteraceae bacterium]
MTALQSTQRRMMTIMASVTATAVVLVGMLGLAGINALRGYEGATKVEQQLVELAPTTVAMLATVDELDDLTTVTVFVLTPEVEGRIGGSIVSVPISCDTTFAIGDTRVPLAEVYDTAGAEALAEAVEGVLSLTLDVWEVANAPAAAVVLAPVGSVPVDLPNDVRTTIDGDAEVLHPRGPADLSVSEFVDVLNSEVDGEPELNRRATVETLWSALAASIGEGTGQVMPEAAVNSVADAFARLVAGPVAARGVATTPMPEALNREGDDVTLIDRVDAVLVFASIAPNSTSAPAPGLVYRIEAPPGYDERVRYAISVLLYFSENVQSVYISSSVPVSQASVLELYDSKSKDRAEDASVVFGETAYAEPAVKIAGVDVVLRLGLDFLTSTEASPPTTPAPEST